MKDFIAYNFVPIVGCAMMFAFVIKNNKLTERKRRFFIITLIIFLLSVLFRNADKIVSDYETYTARRAAYSAFGYFLRPLFAYALLGTDLNINRKKQRILYTLLGIPMIITLFSAFSVFFTDIVYGFHTDTNNFYSGPLGWLNFMALGIYLVVILVLAVIDFTRKNYRHGTMILGTAFLMISAVLFEYFEVREFLSESVMTMALMLYLFFFQDDEFVKERKRLRKEATVDALTGIYNRRAYEDLMENLSKEDNLIAGILVMDIDYFKSINDTYGHDVGDIILKNVAGLLKSTFRTSDYVIRYGGDEFVVIMIGITEDLFFVVKNKIDSINAALDNPAEGIPKVSVSAGVSFSESGVSENLFKQADEALYRVKNSTKKGCAAYDESFDTAEFESKTGSEIDSVNVSGKGRR